MIEKNQNKLCVISLTYNRPEYIKRSFDSLYQRAGISFDHYVFDDNSDEETMKELYSLQKKYQFKLFVNKQTLGIVRNFNENTQKIQKKYDYYVKFDSDIEILSDDFFPGLIDVFSASTEERKITCVTSKAEGLSSYSDRRVEPIEFFKGHAVRFGADIEYGCCLMFSKEVFEQFEVPEQNRKDKWGIDHLLYTFSRTLGISVIVEDLSMYHIDNLFGQRKKNAKYFIKRNRWSSVDNDEVWYLLASERYQPAFIARTHLQCLREYSQENFEKFVKNCEIFIQKGLNTKTFDLKTEIQKNQVVTKKKMFKISSPENFGTTPHLQHGTSILVESIPDWARNNMAVCIESVIVESKTDALEKILTEETNSYEQHAKHSDSKQE